MTGSGTCLGGLKHREGTASRAFATRRADSIEHARIILVNAIERMPNVAIFHYNLACYICQLGDVERAKKSLHRAFKLAPGMRVMALDDEDLKPLWDAIEGILGNSTSTFTSASAPSFAVLDTCDVFCYE